MTKHKWQNRHNRQSVVSRCGEVIVRGDFSRIAQVYEDMADREAERVIAENYKQHAEHYRRLRMGN